MQINVYAKGLKLLTRAALVAVSLCVYAYSLHCMAAPMDGEESTFKQPDGTEITLKFYGDEYYARSETTDGYTVIFDSATKTFFFADLTPDKNEFVSTGKVVGKVNPDTLGLAKRLKINFVSRVAKARKKYEAFEAVLKQEERWKAVKAANNKYREFKKKVKEQEKAGKKGFVVPMGTLFPDSEIPSLPSLASAAEGDGGDTPISPAPPSFELTGTVVGLTVVVDFSDDPAGSITQANIDDYCNKPGYNGFSNGGSIYDYFYAQSAGKLRYNNNVTYYVRVPQPKTYYNDTAVSIGTCGNRLLNDALNVLIANGYDFSGLSTKLEDGKTRVRACNVFFAGNSAPNSDGGLWPHRWALYNTGEKSIGGGVTVWDYQITNIGTSLKIGTFCHENGHMLLGYPDFYDYGYDSEGMGYYSLMAAGNYASSYNPANIHGYLKWHSGWVQEVELYGVPTQNCAARVDFDTIYKYTNPLKAAEYFMIENRSKAGWEANSTVPDSGLLITHNDEGGNKDSQAMTEAQHYETSVEQADGVFDLEFDRDRGDAYDLFHSGGTGSNIIFDDTTLPNAKWWAGADGTPASGTDSELVIHDISAAGSTMTFIYGAGNPSGSAVIGLDANTIDTRCNYGTNAVSETFAVFNAGGGTLSYTIATNQSWLSCSPASGTATTESDTITINFSTSALSAGSYSATITVTDPSASPTTKTITVNLTVADQPVIALSTLAIATNGMVGVSGPQVSFAINNAGGGSMSYTVSKTQSWLTLSQTSGTVVAETDTIYVNLDATTLTPGIYNDTITITSATATNSPQTIAVTYTVLHIDMLVAAPNGGEQWGKGETRNVTWDSSLGGNVKIELYRGGVLDSTITAGTTNDGSFAWPIPVNQTATNSYTVKITSIESLEKYDSSDANFTVLPNLAEALDATEVTWTNSGNAIWFPQINITHDGIDAAQSGAIGGNQTNSIATTIVGPGTLTFWWKVSSEANFDYLRFYTNGVEQTGTLAKISGLVDWIQKTIAISSGSNTVKWAYTKDAYTVGGSDAAWVDQVVYTPAPLPEIVVEQPVATNLIDGSATNDFGSVNMGSSSAPLTFTIKNIGTTNLTSLSLAKSGVHSNDFTLGSLGAITVAPGTSTTFTVTFSPSGTGTRTAALQIASNDGNENPFDIALTGTGVGAGPLVVTPTNQFSASGNYGGPFSPSPQAYVLNNPGGAPLDWTAVKSTAWIDLSSASGTLAAGASATVTVSIASSASTLIPNVYNDTIAFTNTTNGSGNTTRIATLTVNRLPATVTLGNLSQTYNGAARSVTTTTAPTGLVVNVTYAGNAGAPTNSGSYAVVATINDSFYQGGTNGMLLVAKAIPSVTNWPTAFSMDLEQALSNVVLSGGSTSVTGTFSYLSPTNRPPVGIYTAAVEFVASDSINYVSVTGTVVITVIDIYAVPFLETFESRTQGDLDGQRGWVADGAVVQTNKAYGGSTNAAQLNVAGGYMKHAFSDGRTKVWTDMRVQVVQSPEKPTPDSNTTVAVYVWTNSIVWAFDGTNAVSTGFTAQTNVWTRFTTFSDYTTKKYTLYVNDVRVDKYGFYSVAATNFTELKVSGEKTFVDNVGVTPNQPAMRYMPSLILLQ